MVVGDRRPYIAALVTLDEAALAAWAESHHKGRDLSALLGDEDVYAEVQKAIDTANATVSRAEQIRRFTVVASDWTEETGELTPTLKLRRSLLMRRLHDDIELLYD
jgi:long-chain acyl-CoA synthetase